MTPDQRANKQNHVVRRRILGYGGALVLSALVGGDGLRRDRQISAEHDRRLPKGDGPKYPLSISDTVNQASREVAAGRTVTPEMQHQYQLAEVHDVAEANRRIAELQLQGKDVPEELTSIRAELAAISEQYSQEETEYQAQVKAADDWRRSNPWDSRSLGEELLGVAGVLVIAAVGLSRIDTSSEPIKADQPQR